jgi:hypothetical protein
MITHVASETDFEISADKQLPIDRKFPSFDGKLPRFDSNSRLLISQAGTRPGGRVPRLHVGIT